jgi:type I restriction enzyme M protein
VRLKPNVRRCSRKIRNRRKTKDEYLAENVFWVPKEARWIYLQANAKLPTIGKLIDDALVAIEASNPSLK